MLVVTENQEHLQQLNYGLKVAMWQENFRRSSLTYLIFTS